MTGTTSEGGTAHRLAKTCRYKLEIEIYSYSRATSAVPQPFSKFRVIPSLVQPHIRYCIAREEFEVVALLGSTGVRRFD